MLHLFHLNVAKVDLDVGWSGKEERASTGAMAAAVAVNWRQRSTEACASVRADVHGPKVGPHRVAPDQ
jgi:hypothetical protein